MSVPPSRALIAIDPGASGGLVALPADGRPLQVLRMPHTQAEVLEALRGFLRGADEATVYLEKVGGFVRGRERTGASMFENAYEHFNLVIVAG